MKHLDAKTAQALRAEARALEEHANTTDDYPAETQISQPNRASRIFNRRRADGGAP